MTTLQKINFLILIINQLFIFKTIYCQSTLVQDSSNLLIDDMMFTSQSFGKQTAASLSMVPWPNGKVYISLDKLYSTGLKDMFLKAFNEYERETPIDFIERTDKRDYVSVIQTTNKSSSYLGMIGGTQEL